MLRKLPLMAGLFVMAAVLTPHVAVAGKVAPTTTPVAAATVDGPLVQQAQYGGYRRYEDNEYYPRYRRYPDYRRDDYYYRDGYYSRCRYWRHECARRWGWGGWEFRRCLHRHGCGGGYRY